MSDDKQTPCNPLSTILCVGAAHAAGDILKQLAPDGSKFTLLYEMPCGCGGIFSSEDEAEAEAMIMRAAAADDDKESRQ